MLVDKALYRLHTLGAQWAKTLADYLQVFGWEQSQIDPAIWTMDKGSHYIIAWVDDLLTFSKDSMITIDYLKKRF